MSTVDALVFEYRTTFSVVPPDFPCHGRIAEDLAKVNPRPPKGTGWRLASCSATVTKEGPLMLYFWERPAPA